MIKSDLVERVMEATELKKPEAIEFKQIVEAIQGPVSVNKCLVGDYQCPLKGKCPAHSKLAILQSQINSYLKELTLQEFISGEQKNG